MYQLLSAWPQHSFSIILSVPGWCPSIFLLFSFLSSSSCGLLVQPYPQSGRSSFLCLWLLDLICIGYIGYDINIFILLFSRVVSGLFWYHFFFSLYKKLWLIPTASFNNRSSELSLVFEIMLSSGWFQFFLEFLILQLSLEASSGMFHMLSLLLFIIVVYYCFMFTPDLWLFFHFSYRDNSARAIRHWPSYQDNSLWP